MLPTQLALRLQAKVDAVDHAIAEAAQVVTTLEEAGLTEAGRWLPGIRQSLERIELECADLRFAARALRESLPSPGTLQPRLL